MKILGDVLATIICENLLLIYGLGIKRLFIEPEKQMKKEKIIFLLFLSSSLTFIFFCFFKLILGDFIANLYYGADYYFCLRIAKFNTSNSCFNEL